ncbi:MAG: YceI family protein [Blastocatellales bacterium]
MRYRVDASRSRFAAQAFAKGMLSAFGHDPKLAIRDFDGEADFDPDASNAASLWMTARADSLALIDEVSEKDRREIERSTREEVLDAVRYPEITFQSASVAMYRMAEGQNRAQYRLRIVGDLSLHGVKRECLIDAIATIEGGVLRAQGGFSLRQSDFNIRPVSAAGGLLKLKDEVQLSFDILAHELSE